MNAYTQKLAQQTKIRYGLAGGILLLATIFVLYPFGTSLATALTAIQEADASIAATTESLAAKRDEYRTLKSTYSKVASKDSSSIQVILPPHADETGIIRYLEQGLNALSTPEAPLFFESANFSKMLVREDLPYRIVPVKITLSANRPDSRRASEPQGDSVAAALSFLQQTGNIKGEKPSRLISVESVSLSTRDEQKLDAKGNKIGNITLELSLSAYLLPELKAAASEAKKAASTETPTEKN